MKKNRIILTILVSIIIIFFVEDWCFVYADPGSSKGFAEYNDTIAEEESKKIQEEQQQEEKNNEGKSTNNYIKKIEVEGYEISPEFDKKIYNGENTESNENGSNITENTIENFEVYSNVIGYTSEKKKQFIILGVILIMSIIMVVLKKVHKTKKENE